MLNDGYSKWKMIWCSIGWGDASKWWWQWLV